MGLQLGRVVRRVCPKCDVASDGDGPERACPRCGAGLVEIREEADPLIGQRIDGRFEIRARLGQGGMGTVYRAWQPSVGREVAIKLVDRAYASDAMAVTRFEREAQLASRLSQPNTVSVFDSGKTADGQLYIAMELIRGKTLAALLHDGGAFTIERAARIGVQVCDALEAAHALGIVHRDLKLENVIVLDDPPGRDLVKVLDFGLAKLVGDSRGTAIGIVVGTPRYMAPETATSGMLLPAGDLYALGVILAELALGEPLWPGANLAELVPHKLDPSPAIARIPEPLRALCGELLAPQPERRPTAAQTRARLLALGAPAALATAPAPAPPRARQWWPLVVIGGVVLAGAGAVTALALDQDAGASSPADAARIVSARPADAAARRPLADAAVAADAAPDRRDVWAHAATVRLHVVSRPAGAIVAAHGKRIGKAPVDLAVASAATAFRIDGSYRGVTKVVDVIPDHDQDVVLDFEVDAYDLERP